MKKEAGRTRPCERSFHILHSAFCIRTSAFCVLHSACFISLAAPRLVVDQLVWNFDSVTNRSEVAHTFTLRNVGNADVEIQKVVSGCDACLRSVVDKERLAPHESALLHCRLDLRSLRGPVARTVSVYSNDPERPVLALGLSGVTVPCYQVTPVEPVLDLAQGMEFATAEISSLQTRRAPLSQVTASDTNILATLTSGGSNRAVLTLRALPSLPHGRKRISLTLRSDEASDPPCEIMAAVHNPAEFEVLPARLELRPQAAPQVRILWIKQHGGSPLTLLDVVPPSEKFQCEIQPDPAGPDYRVYVTAWDQEPTASPTNRLVLKLSDARQQECSVSVPILVGAAKEVTAVDAREDL